MNYCWMPWNGEVTCSMPYNENLSSQAVDYKYPKCGKFDHDSSSCMGKKKTFGEVLATNYDEIYHRNEPTLVYDHSSQGYAQEPQFLYLDPFHSPPPLSPFEQLIAKMD